MSNPATLSKDGKRNAYFVHCRVHGQQRPYAVCLHHADRIAAGKTNPLYADCDQAIQAGTCQALGMQREELETGQSIYFIERNKAPLPPSERPAAQPEPVDGAAAVTATPKPRTPVESGYAAAINAALKEQREAIAQASLDTVSPVVAAPKPPALPGESPLAYARRIKALQEGKTA